MKKRTNSNVRSQDATEIFSPSGNAYAANKRYFLRYESLIGPKAVPYIINNKDELIDIDNNDDYRRALSIFKKNLLKK